MSGNNKYPESPTRRNSDAIGRTRQGLSEADIEMLGRQMQEGLRQQAMAGLPWVETLEAYEERIALEEEERLAAQKQQAEHEEVRLDYETLQLKTLPLPLSADLCVLSRINRAFVRGVDKWHRQYLGFGSCLEAFDGETLVLRIEASQRCEKNHEALVSRVVTKWKQQVTGLAGAQRFVVKVFTLRRGEVGGTVTPADYEDPDAVAAAIAAIIERMKLAGEELKQPGYPYVEYRGDFDDPDNLVVICHPDFRHR